MTARRMTNLLPTVALLAGIAFLALASVATAQDVANKLTYFTFSKPVQLPGNVQLPAGKYQFRLADATTGRRVVQVLDEKGKVYALLLTIPALKPEASLKPQVRFMEVPENQPPAVKTWWYTNETYGYEFVYPKQQAAKLARATGVSIPMTEAPMTTTKELETAEVTRPEVPAQPIAAASVLETVVASNEPAALPRTASPLGLIGLIGMLSLAGAAGIRHFSTR
jgi:hypothetical protein